MNIYQVSITLEWGEYEEITAAVNRLRSELTENNILFSEVQLDEFEGVSFVFSAPSGFDHWRQISLVAQEYPNATISVFQKDFELDLFEFEVWKGESLTTYDLGAWAREVAFAGNNYAPGKSHVEFNSDGVVLEEQI